MKKILTIFSFSGLCLLTGVRNVSAEDLAGSAAARTFVGKLNDVILFPLIGLLMGVALLMFVIGAAEYVMGADNPTAREKGVKHITYGIIGMVVMVSAWAILGLAVGTFGLTVPE